MKVIRSLYHRHQQQNFVQKDLSAAEQTFLKKNVLSTRRRGHYTYITNDRKSKNPRFGKITSEVSQMNKCIRILEIIWIQESCPLDDCSQSAKSPTCDWLKSIAGNFVPAIINLSTETKEHYNTINIGHWCWIFSAEDQFSPYKVISTVLCDSRGVIHIDFLRKAINGQ